jgi:NAD(P)-dependent dehydrogenase (short-subunit alcohol dehydrogenase family)
VGPFDRVFHNAGVDVEGTVETLALDVWDRAFAVNVRPAHTLLHHLLPGMRARRRGAIVMGGSNAGVVARATDPVYCATKAALAMLARAVALDVAADGVRINVIAPGPVDTPSMGDPAAAVASTPARTYASPGEVARLVHYLLSDDARFITGAVVPIDGGKTAGHNPRRP